MEQDLIQLNNNSKDKTFICSILYSVLDNNSNHFTVINHIH